MGRSSLILLGYNFRGRSVSFPRLEEYGENFIEFLKGNHEKFATTKQQEHTIAGIVEIVFDRITKEIWKNLENIIFETSEKVSAKQVRDSTKQEIKKALDYFENFKDMYSIDEIKNLEDSLFNQFGKIIEKSREELFDKLPLDKDDIENLNRICVYLLSKDFLMPIYSGIVFAGYGKDDLLPACSSYLFESLICGKLKYRVNTDGTRKIDFSGASAAIVPLAQTDVTHNFIMGAHPLFLDLLHGKLTEELEMSDSDVKEFIDALMDRMFDNYATSIYQAVNSLPKEDLAIVAETLVNMTSFMRKVSMTLETVGGPVDVAVISKQDGFVWIKRKRYYNSSNNLHLSY